MLASEEIERLENLSVERERLRYSNDELWAWLISLKERENEIVQQVEVAYYHAFSWRSDSGIWRKRWNSLCNELSANQPMIELLAWHLTKRGDQSVAGWLKENDERQRHLVAKSQTVGWRMANG